MLSGAARVITDHSLNLSGMESLLEPLALAKLGAGAVIAVALIYEWLIQSARRLSLLEYISLLAIALLILQMGFIAGVFIGVIIGCATFAVSASRVNAIKFSFDGSEPLDARPRAERTRHPRGAWPRNPRHGLQSYLFFGSANRLYQQVKSLFAARPDRRFLLFDFRLVTRYRLLGHTQLHPDQAGSGRARRPSRAGELVAGAPREVQLPRGSAPLIIHLALPLVSP